MKNDRMYSIIPINAKRKGNEILKASFICINPLTKVKSVVVKITLLDIIITMFVQFVSNVRITMFAIKKRAPIYILNDFIFKYIMLLLNWRYRRCCNRRWRRKQLSKIWNLSNRYPISKSLRPYKSICCNTTLHY